MMNFTFTKQALKFLVAELLYLLQTWVLLGLFQGGAARKFSYMHLVKSFTINFADCFSEFLVEEYFYSKYFQILVKTPVPAGTTSCGGDAITKL